MNIMRRKTKKKIAITIIILIIILIGAGVYYVFFRNKNNGEEGTIIDKIIKEEPPAPKLKIVDETSKSRPFAVMINNIAEARPYQSGLQDAYIIYEIIVEGGITRYMAVFKDQSTERIGSIRSARHYFIDYAMENDAYYIHWGWSPQARNDISKYKINNLNGLAYEGKYFLRDKNLRKSGISSEHTGYTTMELLKAGVEKVGYRNETNQKLLLNYSVDPVDLSENEDAIKATTITIPYSNSIKTKYVYDPENKYYLRSVNGTAQKDYVTKKQYHFKNIITYQVKNSTISGGGKGRQTISNIGSGKGYYITDGYAVPILWEKKSRESQTKYTLTDGTEIDVNDGNTFIQIQPTGQKLTIE